MTASAGKGLNVRKTRRCKKGYAPQPIPADDCSVGFDRRAEIVTRRDSHHVRESRRNICLPRAVEAPTHDCSVATECKAVDTSCRDGDDVRQALGQIILPEPIVAPSDHRLGIA